MLMICEKFLYSKNIVPVEVITLKNFSQLWSSFPLIFFTTVAVIYILKIFMVQLIILFSFYICCLE
jgi:hypothetical protein